MEVVLFLVVCGLFGWAFVVINRSEKRADPGYQRKRREAALIKKMCNLPGTWGERKD